MTAATEELVPPKHILVNGRRIRLRWLQQIIWSFLAANIGALIISALYYIFVELRWQVGGHTILDLKPKWDNLFSFQGWKTDRSMKYSWTVLPAGAYTRCTTRPATMPITSGCHRQLDR